MRNLEIKKIGIGSVFRFYFTFGAIIGLLLLVIVFITGASLQNIGAQMGIINLNTSGALQIWAIIIGTIIGSLAYGLICGLAGIIGALIYNIFAGMVGGIVVKLEEKD